MSKFQEKHKINIYLYPNISLGTDGFINPYINNLADALSASNMVLNKESPANNGLLDILKYLKRIDVVYLNWIEDLPDKRGGFIQSIIFIFLMFYFRLFKKKVVWTLHNKKSHSDKHKILKSILYRILLKNSDLVITHAREGLDYIPMNTRKEFITHPIKSLIISDLTQPFKEYDIIIWGSITEYKGIDTFLAYLLEKSLLTKYRILIAGKIVGSELEDFLESINQEYDCVTLINSFIEEHELYDLIGKSKVVLFCYHSDSILSSGALMDSLQLNTKIIGPSVGAFHDLEQEGIIYTFNRYNDLISTLDEVINDSERTLCSTEKISNFITRNSWDRYSEQIDIVLRQL